MNDRDRLIDIIYCAGRDYDDYVDAQHEIGMSAHEDFDSWLADDLLANGVILPPCKVGDRVFIIEKEYRLNKVEHKIITCEIEFIYVSSKTKRYHTKKLECPYMDNGFNFRPKDIGKTVFLTKEEAEQKLKEREGK